MIGPALCERVRGGIPALALLLVVISLADILFSAATVPDDCWVLPNGHVLRVPFLDGCVEPATGQFAGAVPEPLAARVRDFLRALSASALLLFVPLVLFLRSTAASAPPLLIFYSCLAAVVAAALGRRSSTVASYSSMVALCVAPAALFHLGLTFPKRRPVLLEVPRIVIVPYWVSLGLLAVGLFAIDSRPLLWPSLLSLIGALGTVAWMILMGSCWFALRESRSRFEQARAQLVLSGCLLLPLAPTLLHALHLRSSGGALQTYLWSSAALMPLPIALAITHYNLFDIGMDVRRILVRGLHVALATSVLLGAFWISLGSLSLGPRHGAELFLASVAAAFALAALQPRIGAAFESAFIPELERLRALHVRIERAVAQCSDDSEVASLLLAGLEEALSPLGGSVWSAEGSGFRLLARMGSSDPGPAVEEACGALGAEDCISLALLSEAELDRLPELVRADVEIVARLCSPRGEHGLVLLASRRSRTPYRGFEIAFAASLASHAAAALAHLQLTRELLRNERAATTGRIAVGLAHDLGKDLDWLSRLVRRLPERLDQPEKLARDVKLLVQFTGGIVEGVRSFIEDALRKSASPAQLRPASEVIDASVRRAARLHGDERISVSVDPALRRLNLHEDVQRAIVNLLDNALRAGPASEPVRLYASQRGSRVEILVEDRGSGIPEELLEAVRQPGFTTRAREGGTGVGLAVAGEIASSHGGSLELGPRPRGGTRARISLPISAGDA